jgi:phage shock protein E
LADARASTRRRAALVGLLATLVAGCTGGNQPTTAPTATSASPHAVIHVEAFAALLDDPGVLAVNVHVPYEGELPGTDAFAPYDRIREWDGLPSDRDATVAVYCMSGNMSRQAALALVEAGYTDVRELDGGMLAWQDTGRDLVTRDASDPPDG